MKIAHITTTNSLKIISACGDIDFCLIPYAIKDAKYFNYFKEQSKNNRYIICDWTIAENEDKIDMDKLIDYTIRIGGSEIIIPDVISDYQKTKQLKEEFLKKYYQKLKDAKIRIMSVIQGQTLDEFEKCLEEINNDNRIDVIGVPFRMNYNNVFVNHKDLNHMINRVFFIAHSEFRKPVHCLGCNLIQEFFILKDLNRIRSIDSKILARYGLNDKLFSFEDIEKPEKKLYIDDKLNIKQINMTLSNIIKLKKSME